MRLSEPKPRETLGFDIDDGTGLRVAHARFKSESKFSRSMFDGYDCIRILTYKALRSAILAASQLWSYYQLKPLY